MNIIIRFGLLLLFISLSHSAHSQKLNHRLGDILVRPSAGSDIEEFRIHFSYFDGKSTELKVEQITRSPFPIWKAQFNNNNINEYHFLNHIKRHPLIEVAQFNHLSKLRATIPNDPLFPQQWQYINDGSLGGVEDADIDMDLAWDISTGGLTPNGDTIVVCIVDDGLDCDHEDIVDNLWINYAEIPDDGIDDDGNGYVDDYYGYNTVSGEDNVCFPGTPSSAGAHGTSVTGIIGAKGNNGIGVSGVNWDVKLMIVKRGSGDEADALKAYGYPYEMRKKYNDTNGAEGAFVVTVNSSWGADMVMASEAPLWCGFFDTLGEEGILSCGATINDLVNVDVVGDLPTTCPSEYLISVTNLDRTNTLNDAGYGPVSIDLGAPGQDVFKTRGLNGYGDILSGTSFSTPHVAGTVALLYSSPCQSLANLASNDPSGAALLVKQYILFGVDPNESLEGMTVTGGSLNVHNSMQRTIDNCLTCPPPSSIHADDITDTQANIYWIPTDVTNAIDIRYRKLGDPNWMNAGNVSSPFLINGLIACTEYEYQVKTFCDGESTPYTDSFFFKSDGCCVPPNDIEVSNITNNNAIINWTNILAATGGYNLRWREIDGAWNTISLSSGTDLLFEDLTPCTEYEIQVQTICSTGPTNYSAGIFFETIGCGACTDFEYCESEGGNSSEEWIERVQIGSLDNQSGNDGGYGEFTTLFNNFEVNQSYAVKLTPGFNGNAFHEYFKVWIDFDQNGEFDNTNELAFESGDPSTSSVEGNIWIPCTAIGGNTRMRVSMKFTGATYINLPSNVCEPPTLLEFGEVEDYCVNIVNEPINCTAIPSELIVTEIGDSFAKAYWSGTPNATEYTVRYKLESATDWIEKTTENENLWMGDLAPDNNYELQVNAICNCDISAYTESVFFSTFSLSNDNISEVLSAKVFPNPFVNEIQVNLELAASTDINLILTDAQGKVVSHQFEKLSSGEHTINFLNQTTSLSQGIYFLQIKSEEGTIVKKIVKM